MPGKPKHGLSHMSEYRAWQTMRLRCTVPDNPAYAAYGGRGIKVCDRWRNDVLAFYHDMGPKPTPAHELDRIDNNKGYSPNNCRWVDRKTNSRNRRSNRMLRWNGTLYALSALAEKYGIRPDTLAYRLDCSKMSLQRALTTPVRKKAPNGSAAPRPRKQRNATGYDGVQQQCSGTYRIRCLVNGRRVHKGKFKDPKSAHDYYVKLKSGRRLPRRSAGPT